MKKAHGRSGGGGDLAGRRFGDRYDGGDAWAGGKRYGEAGMAFDGGAMPDDIKVPSTGTSIFDPVLCELMYSWFCPPGGHILDPFAGGSVRGIVAAMLGRQYTGIDLSARQIAANEEQAQAICNGQMPQWVVGDARDALTLAPAGYDFIFTCPPYYDLEVYTDDPADLSQCSDYGEFRDAYTQIIADCCSMLKEDRFAAIVVGEVRDKQGNYCGLVPDTVNAFTEAGLAYYNEAVLVTAVGSLPIRVGKQFDSGRKLGKTHQNVLVFLKGDAKKATEAIGEAQCAVWPDTSMG